jgi:hypothetical protein
MDLVEGAKLLTELLGDHAELPAEPTPQVESESPIFRWLGIERPEASE